MKFYTRFQYEESISIFKMSGSISIKDVTEVYQYLECQEVYQSSSISVLSYRYKYLKEVFRYKVFASYKYVNILPYCIYGTNSLI